MNDRSDGKSLSFFRSVCVCVNVKSVFASNEKFIIFPSREIPSPLVQPHSLRVFTFSEAIQLRKEESNDFVCGVCVCVGI